MRRESSAILSRISCCVMSTLVRSASISCDSNACSLSAPGVVLVDVWCGAGALGGSLGRAEEDARASAFNPNARHVQLALPLPVADESCDLERVGAAERDTELRRDDKTDETVPQRGRVRLERPHGQREPRLGMLREFLDLFLGEVVEGIRVLDRKSTRLNSSHVRISYAVF